MKRSAGWIVAAIGIVVIAAGALGFYRPRLTTLAGDPWNYNLTAQDLPSGWQVDNTEIQTAFDVARQPAATPNASTVTPKGLRSFHLMEFSHPAALDIFYASSQVILYDTTENARAAMAAENLGAEWEKLAASRTLGDETVVWHLLPVADAPDQAIYRVDFRFLNGVASIGLTGTVDGLKGDGEAISYAAKVLEKMRKFARPDALNALGTRYPDLRGLLLSQDELAQLDPNYGDRWIYNSSLLPSWTPNSDFPNPDGMAKLGRLVGYQIFMIKPLTDDELKPGYSTGLFQQVTVFTSPESARQTLEKMVGLEGGEWVNPPQVGEAAKGWTQEYQSESTLVGSGVVAATEITFRMGAYVGSIRLQTSPAIQLHSLEARAANEQLANALASALAEKLKKAGK